jgi:hypothetical protein
MPRTLYYELVKWFCSFCWKEVLEKNRMCPYYGKDLGYVQSLSYEDKLLLGLDNPITPKRMLVIELIGKKKVKRATEKLYAMLFEDRDIYKLMVIAKALYSIGLEEAVECLKKKAGNEGILGSFIKKLIKDTLEGLIFFYYATGGACKRSRVKR